MDPVSNRYRCRECGAASYARLVQRRPDGTMGYTDRYRCSGCQLTFGDPAEWRRPTSAGAVAERPRADHPT